MKIVRKGLLQGYCSHVKVNSNVTGAAKEIRITYPPGRLPPHDNPYLTPLSFGVL